MTSSLLSRFRPLADPSAASIYETIREHDEEINDRNDEFDHAFDVEHDDALRSPTAQASMLRDPESLSTIQSRQGVNRVRTADPATSPRTRRSRPNPGPGLSDLEELEDDVPASLLIENDVVMPSPPYNRHAAQHQRNLPQELRERRNLDPPSPVQFPTHPNTLPLHNTTPATNLRVTAGRKEKAMWRWANVENLDNFLNDVYEYYLSKGFWAIILKRVLNLLTVAFIVGFCLFLTQCIDYSRVKGSSRLQDIMVKRCTARMGFVPNAILWLTTFVCITRSFQYVVDLRRLNHMHDFYLHLLDVPEAEIQSISWQEVVGRLMALRDSNPNIRLPAAQQTNRFLGTQSKQRMDAHDIANRLMRKENYMIALINKEILDTTLNLPLIGTRQIFTRTLEWHLNYCIMDYIFSPQGQVRQLFLKDTHRKALSEGLRRRFIFAGTTSLLIAPFLIIYFIVQNFFAHFNEYQKDPARIGARQYNVHAQWKFREFNELWHLFTRRLKMSHPFATRYINQFPKDKTVQAARFVTFVSGAVVSVLGLATVLDQENFLGFEITSGRTTIFYLGVFGSIWAVARGMLPDENMIYDSSYSMEEVIEFTHFKPPHWEGRLHTVEVKAEFEQLYQMQILVLLDEILSMIFTPFVLWFSLPKCSDRIIDFFREFTVHVDGLGYVCSFAEFNFKKAGQIGTGGNAGTRATNPTEIAARARNEYFGARDDKLERSYWGFMNDYSRNPKTDISYPYGTSQRVRAFHQPPPFPGLLSPTMPQQNKPNKPQSSAAAETANMAAYGGDADLMPKSLLLDPHHQPNLRSSSALQGRTSKSKNRVSANLGDTILSTAVKEEDEGEVHTTTASTAVEPNVISQAGHSGVEGLGSWKYDDFDGADSEEIEDPDAIINGGGVLGLVKQFQKAQEDDKRGSSGV